MDRDGGLSPLIRTHCLFNHRDAAAPVLPTLVNHIAPTTKRIGLLAQLVRALGLLSLLAVAGGVLPKLRFRDAPGPLNPDIADALVIDAEQARPGVGWTARQGQRRDGRCVSAAADHRDRLQICFSCHQHGIRSKHQLASGSRH
jgi:hypothetical protein